MSYGYDNRLKINRQMVKAYYVQWAFIASRRFSAHKVDSICICKDRISWSISIYEFSSWTCRYIWLNFAIILIFQKTLDVNDKEIRTTLWNNTDYTAMFTIGCKGTYRSIKWTEKKRKFLPLHEVALFNLSERMITFN